MRAFCLKVGFILPLLLVSCDNPKEKDEVDYDHMVKNEEESEWISSPNLEGKHVAGDLFPEPQEVIIQEAIDAPSPLDSSTIR